jgi:hypothetical protein
MSVTPVIGAGGDFDKIKRINVVDEVKKIHFPPHLFPEKTRPFSKGFMLQVPPMAGRYEEVYVTTEDMELIDVGLACSGYADGDYWELVVNTEKIIETMYTKEVPQSINMGTTLYTVVKLPAGTELRLQFYNQSQTAKNVWFDLRFLR